MARTLAERDQQLLAAKATKPAAPAAAPAPLGYDPVKEPWKAPLDGPAPAGYTRVGNQWSYTGTPADFSAQYPESPLAEQTVQPAPAPAAAAPATAPATSGGTDLQGWVPPGGGSYAAPAPAPAAPVDGIQGAFRTALERLLKGPTAEEAAANVLTSVPVTAFNANAKRQEARDRQFLAERAAAEGTSDSGGFESNLLGLRARTGEAMNRFAGEQANYLMEGRRQELLQAMSMAMAMGDNEAARALQGELARMNDATQRYGIDVGASNQRAALDFDRSRWQDQLGLDYATLEQQMNQQALMALLAGA